MVKNKKTYCIGVMSGTSLDGVDLVYVSFFEETKITFEIITATTIPYSSEWQKRLKNSITLSGEKLTQLNTEYGYFLGNLIKEFIIENALEKIDFIASHGHTVFHNPSLKYTLQIGNGPEITSVTGVKSITNFREQDVALGGQGAPLVPIGDELLFSNYDFCLNLGGFSNISMNKNGKRIAFDICPLNIVLNHYAEQLNVKFDNNGDNARKGTINEQLLHQLNALDFYSYQQPKSLGFEYVLEAIFPKIDAFSLSTYDVLKTYIEHCAIQIANTIGNVSTKKVLVTGGGTYNKFLIERIQFYTSAQLILPSSLLIDFKEALIFALLGFLRIHNKVNCLQSVTGAKKDHSSGIIYK